MLATAIFVSMSIEFLPGGLLPNIGKTFDRPVTEVGHLISVFAAAVVFTTTPLAVLTRRAPRKPLAVGALAGIAATMTLAAVAPTFEVLVVARMAGGVAHGLFWSVAAAYAAELVASSQLGRATAITAAGGSIASVLGVPMGNALGQVFGWRVSFGVVAAVAAIVGILVVVLLPAVSSTGRQPEPPVAAGGEGKAPSSLPGILLVCGMILLVVIGQTTYGTYLVVWLGKVASMPSPSIPFFLFATGLAAFIAVCCVGRLVDRFPHAALVTAVALLALLNAILPLAAAWGPSALVVVALLQAMTFAVVPTLLQTRMMRIALPHQRSIAAALQTTAFNIAIGGGAVAGALIINTWGLEALPWAASLTLCVGLIVLIVPRRRTKYGAPQHV